MNPYKNIIAYDCSKNLLKLSIKDKKIRNLLKFYKKFKFLAYDNLKNTTICFLF